MVDRVLKIMDENWDVLIILDGCRYDTFKEVYREFFDGLNILKKVISPSTGTQMWLHNNFCGKDCSNIIYINPIVNFNKWLPKHNFFQVVMAWEKWNDTYGTIMPEDTTEIALRYMKRFPDKRFIIHYMQPHAPYISKDFFAEGFPNPFTNSSLRSVQGYHRNEFVESIVNTLGALLLKIKVIKHTWELREKLKLPPASPMDATRRKYGAKGLRKAYKENLKIVLEYVAKLSHKILYNYPTKKILITADHGEFLGENGRYSHNYGSKYPLLVEVPLLKINNTKR